jgi:methyltransferase (TIGR00027 family)
MQPGEVSMTARGVAAHRQAFERVPAPYGDPAADQRLQEDVAAGLEMPMTMTRYLDLRTRHFDRVVVDALDAGIGQVVALGAGYDGRSLRYAKAGVRHFEVDHPVTQADKRARLDALGIDARAVAFVAVDFTVDDLAAALDAAGHDPTVPTLITCEGVAGYVSLDDLAAVLAVVAARAASGSRLAIEVPIAPDSPAEAERRTQLRSVVAGLGEPLVSDVDRAEVRPYLASCGWDVDTATDPLGVDISESTRATAFVLARPG